MFCFFYQSLKELFVVLEEKLQFNCFFEFAEKVNKNAEATEIFKFAHLNCKIGLFSLQFIKITFFVHCYEESFKTFQLKYHSTPIPYSILRDWSALSYRVIHGRLKYTSKDKTNKIIQLHSRNFLAFYEIKFIQSGFPELENSKYANKFRS